MIEIHLYGKLRNYSNGSVSGRDVVLTPEPNPGETLESLLARIGIPSNEINHIFFNSKLLVSRSQVATMFGLPQVEADISHWNLAIPVGHGDRIGLFGLDIPVLSM
jgi:hypothetical protein